MTRPTLRLKLDAATSECVTSHVRGPAPKPLPPAGLAVLRETWPSLFDPERPLPLALGIRDAIREALPDLSRSALNKALGWHVSRWPYLMALSADGAMRHGLDGTPLWPVTPEHRADAFKRLARRRPSRAGGPSRPRGLSP
jgi:sRNA-binding protein